MDSRKGILVAVLIVLTTVTPLFAESVTLFRVFLNDGTAVVSYGEYARVGDRVVFSMPISALRAGNEDPKLHIVNLPASVINWPATSKYTESARFVHYMANYAEADYSALAGEVAAALNAIVVTRDPKVRLSMAVDARRRLAVWPRDHYGYRADDVREMLGLLDEAISGLRVAAGERAFAVDLIATAVPPAPRVERVPLLQTPTAVEILAQAVAIAKVTDITQDRMSILRGVAAELGDKRNGLPSRWASPTRDWALDAIEKEMRISEQYAALTSTLLKRATEAAGKADVRSVEKLVETVKRADAELGSKRPEEISTLLEHVGLQADAARALRLARDQWHEQIRSYQAYVKVAAPAVIALMKAQRTLDDIKKLSGSDPRQLVVLGERFGANIKVLEAASVPDRMKPGHALLVSAVNLAERAVRSRRKATVSGELGLAWDASAAAAGSMMLLTKAKEDMEAALRLPQIR